MKNQQDQQDQHGINVLEELRRLILLSAEEHGEEMADHSAELLAHIERTLDQVRERHDSSDS